MRKFKKWLEHLLKHNPFIQTLYRVIMSAVFRFIGIFVKTDEKLVLMNGHGFRYNADEVARREVVKTTYENARARGERVYFVDGETVFGIFGGDGGSVDGCHPNDLGFACVAAALDPIFAEIYGEK